MQGSTYTQPRHWEEVGRLVLRSAAFTHEETPGTHFIGGWVDPRTSLNTKEWWKISTPSDTRDWTRAVHSVAKRLAAWAIWPATINRIFKNSAKLRPYVPITLCPRVYTGWKGNKCHFLTDGYLCYKETKIPLNFFLILIFNELFKFETSDEWRCWETGTSSLYCKDINL